jgi:hypothetical protein
MQQGVLGLQVIVLLIEQEKQQDKAGAGRVLLPCSQEWEWNGRYQTALCRKYMWQIERVLHFRGVATREGIGLDLLELLQQQIQSQWHRLIWSVRTVGQRAERYLC